MCRKLFFPILLLGALAATQARAADVEWIRAAYWDTRYPTAWVDATAGGAVRDALQAAGYEILDADQLKTWMTARIADKKYSVVVFCRDIAPDTVCESMTASCTLRKYLDAGGKIVFFGDIPFYNQSHADGTNTNWADAGATGILGFNTSSATRDSGSTAAITTIGARWGLTATWTSQRPLAPSVTTNVDILATDNAGAAPAWVKHYVTNDKFRGFVRFRDTGGQPNVEDVIRVAEYVGVKATSPTPADGATGVTMGLFQWTAGNFAARHNVYLGTTPELTEANLIGNRLTGPATFYPALQSGTQYFWRVDEIEADGTIRTGDVWTFTTAPVNAFDPHPRNGDKWIDLSTDLTWTPGQGADSHDVYFSTDEAAVANRDPAVKINQYGTAFAPGLLAEETTYYWAVDEVTATGTNMGEVWRFTTTGPGGGVKGEYFNGMTPGGEPALTRIDDSINFNWGDASGPGDPIGIDQFSARWTADLEISIPDTYTFITTSDDGARLWLNDEQIVNQWVDQGTTDAFSKGIYLEPGIYPLVMEYYENGGGAVAQLSWQSTTMAREIIPAGPLQPPVRARAVYPADRDVNVPQDVVLQWTAGDKALAHQVYFGDDAEAVANATPDTAGIYQGEQDLDSMSFDPGGLEWNKTYYWRIDEVNSTDADSPWVGPVWSFTTANFIVVDDFENYDDAGNRIFDAWVDGYVDKSNGAIVGYIDSLGGTFGELVITHDGSKQSMPYEYNNVNQPYYSEAVREFDPTQNWTINGVSDLTIWLRGYPATYLETAPGEYTLGANTGDIWGTADNFQFLYKTLNGDGAISAKVVGVTGGSATWAKTGVMIRDTLDPSSAYALMHPTPDGRRAFQNRPSYGASAISNHSDPGAVTFPVWVKVERKGSQFSAYYSQDGKTWTLQPDTENVDGGSINPQMITMGNTVLIGLAVTSNNSAGGYCFAQFADVVTSGGATGAFKAVSVGANPGNAPESLYVILEDSSGKKVTVVNPDPAAVNAMDWTAWKIPLSQFSGMSLTKVKRMTIGVGSRTNPVQDGSGLLFIDDIRVTKP